MEHDLLLTNFWHQ